MPIWKRPSFYLAVVPLLAILIATILHSAMGCGYECEGAVSGPIDRVALFLLYLFGYGLWLFLGFALAVFLIELAFQKRRKHRNAA
jgi:hypothetical protein